MAGRSGGRQLVSSGSRYEQQFGYSRAVRVGNVVHVAGTTGIGPDGKVVAPGDGYLQAKRTLEIIQRALEEAGAGLEHVVRTRVFVTDKDQVEPALRAHGEVFADIRPATSLIGIAYLIDPAMVVEIEAIAIIPAD